MNRLCRNHFESSHDSCRKNVESKELSLDQVIEEDLEELLNCDDNIVGSVEIQGNIKHEKAVKVEITSEHSPVDRDTPPGHASNIKYDSLCNNLLVNDECTLILEEDIKQENPVCSDEARQIFSDSVDPSRAMFKESVGSFLIKKEDIEIENTSRMDSVIEIAPLPMDSIPWTRVQVVKNIDSSGNTSKVNLSFEKLSEEQHSARTCLSSPRNDNSLRHEMKDSCFLNCDPVICSKKPKLSKPQKTAITARRNRKQNRNTENERREIMMELETKNCQLKKLIAESEQELDSSMASFNKVFKLVRTGEQVNYVEKNVNESGIDSDIEIASHPSTPPQLSPIHNPIGYKSFEKSSSQMKNCTNPQRQMQIVSKQDEQDQPECLAIKKSHFSSSSSIQCKPKEEFTELCHGNFFESTFHEGSTNPKYVSEKILGGSDSKYDRQKTNKLEQSMVAAARCKEWCYNPENVQDLVIIDEAETSHKSDEIFHESCSQNSSEVVSSDWFSCGPSDDMKNLNPKIFKKQRKQTNEIDAKRNSKIVGAGECKYVSKSTNQLSEISDDSYSQNSSRSLSSENLNGRSSTGLKGSDRKLDKLQRRDQNKVAAIKYRRNIKNSRAEDLKILEELNLRNLLLKSLVREKEQELLALKKLGQELFSVEKM